MSRTYKDRSFKVRFPEEQINYDRVQLDPSVYLYSWIQLPGIKTKKKRKVNTTWDWIGATPSWWTYMFMIRPRRSRENQALKLVKHIQNLEDFDFVDVRRKPHIYYW